MLNNEEKVGVSVHTMTRKIDEGIVIAQKSLQINPRDTFFSLYEKCFKLSVAVVIEAMRKVERGDFRPIISGLENSYYSYSSWKDVCKFRRMGKKIL